MNDVMTVLFWVLIAGTVLMFLLGLMDVIREALVKEQDLWAVEKWDKWRGVWVCVVVAPRRIAEETLERNESAGRAHWRVRRVEEEAR